MNPHPNSDKPWDSNIFQPFTPLEHHQSQGHRRLIERSLSAKNGKDLETSRRRRAIWKTKKLHWDFVGISMDWFTEKKERLSGVDSIGPWLKEEVWCFWKASRKWWRQVSGMFWDAHWSWIFLNDLWNLCATLQSTSNCFRPLTHNLWSGIPENHSIPLQTLGRLLPFGPIQTGAVNAETPMSAVLDGHWLWPKSWTRLKTGSSPKNSCFHLGSTCFKLLQPVQTSRLRPSVATHAGAHHAVTQILHQALNGHGLQSCEAMWGARPSPTPGLCGMA